MTNVTFDGRQLDQLLVMVLHVEAAGAVAAWLAIPARRTEAVSHAGHDRGRRRWPGGQRRWRLLLSALAI